MFCVGKVTRLRAHSVVRGMLARLFPAVLVVWGLGACRGGGLSNGAACGRATECESLVCSFQLPQDASPDGRAQGTCVGRCESSAQCATGLVCGRYDFRGIVPDSGGPDGEGVREGPDFEVLRACRPPLNARCATDGECRAHERCFGAPDGVCAQRCQRSSECGRTFFCITASNAEACGDDGVCLPECDDGVECGRGQYCAFAFGGNGVRGRCASREPMEAGCPPSTDAATDATDANDGIDATVPDAGELDGR